MAWWCSRTVACTGWRAPYLLPLVVVIVVVVAMRLRRRVDGDGPPAGHES